MADRVTIVVDTREQLPLAFDPDITETVRRALPAGDYSIDGYEQSVAVERKTLDDLVSTVIRGRRRFYKELARLASYGHACVVVEANLSDVIQKRYRGGAHPNAIFGSVLHIIVDSGIPVFFCSNRQVACKFVQDYLQRVYRKVTSNEKTADR